MMNRKQKIDKEDSMFDDEWFENKYCCQTKWKAICLSCQIKIACLKKFDIKQL